MSRIAPLEAPYEPEVQAMFDKIMPPDVPPLLLFRTLARSKRAWSKFLAGSLLDKAVVPLRVRELVITRTCALTNCEYEWGIHVTLFGERAGLSAEEIAATCDPNLGSVQWTDAERALLGAVDALHRRASLTDAEFDTLAKHFEETQILEILLLCGFYRTVAYLANGLALPPEPGAPRFPGGPS